MNRIRGVTSILAICALALVPVACHNTEKDRQALKQDELSRNLDMALKGDSAGATFKDTATAPARAAAPEPKTPPRRAPVRRAPPRETKPAAPEPAAPAPKPSEPAVVTRSVAQGTSFNVKLNRTLSTDSSSPGEAFTATLTQPMVDASGNVVVPSGAVVHGTVTAVQKSGHVGQTAVIKLAFQRVSFGGHSYPLQASVQEAHPQRRNRTSTKESATKIAIGAAAGAILGQVLGHKTSSTLKGAAIGAAAGTAIALGTASVDAVLPAGSNMVLRTDAPLTVTTARR